MRSPDRLRAAFQAGLVLVAVGLACWLAYRPGLHSGFLFDDAANLPVLGEYGHINSLDRLLRYLTSGRADPTGRPLSLLSLLLDARDWPAPSYSFKRTNLLIHLINGALLYTLLKRLGSVLQMPPSESGIAAVIGAGVWLLHPLFVSTVLYAVQREAMLPALFALLGLHAWLSARRRMLEGRSGGAACLLMAILGVTALAALSKPNGLLFPVLVLVVESVIPKPNSPEAARYRRWLLSSAGPVALLVLCGLMLVAVRNFGSGEVEGRNFSTFQRLITEPAILLKYLQLLFLVDPRYGSLFHDQYVPAANLLSPWWTLPAILACFAACLLASITRRRCPAISLAVLFYFAGHLMESSSLSLELYFEHRNYLPSVMLFWPLGLALTGSRWRIARVGLSAALLASLTFLTYTTARIWGSPLERAEIWVREAPDSPRAQVYAAQIEAEHGLLPRSISRIDHALRQFPSELQVVFTAIDLHCQRGSLNSDDLTKAEAALRETRRDPGALLSRWVLAALDQATNNRCRDLDIGALKRLLDAAVTNARIQTLPGRMQDIAHLRGIIALQNGDVNGAKTQFDEALKWDPSPAAALEQAARLGGAGHPQEGLAHLDFFETLRVPSVPLSRGMPWVHARLLEHQGYWPKELSNLRHTLSVDARNTR